VPGDGEDVLVATAAHVHHKEVLLGQRRSNPSIREK